MCSRACASVLVSRVLGAGAATARGRLARPDTQGTGGALPAAGGAISIQSYRGLRSACSVAVLSDIHAKLPDASALHFVVPLAMAPQLSTTPRSICFHCVELTLTLTFFLPFCERSRAAWTRPSRRRRHCLFWILCRSPSSGD
eukprot:3697876-Pleurochrysis_carterae.AAC.1